MLSKITNKILLCIFLALSTSPQTLFGKRFNDLVMILGKETGKNTIIREKLAQLIHEKNVPIITHAHILDWVLNGCDKAAQILAEQVKTEKPKDISQFIKEKAPSLRDKKEFKDLTDDQINNASINCTLCLMIHVEPNRDWYIYNLDKSDVIVLVPAPYVIKKLHDDQRVVMDYLKVYIDRQKVAAEDIKVKSHKTAERAANARAEISDLEDKIKLISDVMPSLQHWQAFAQSLESFENLAYTGEVDNAVRTFITNLVNIRNVESKDFKFDQDVLVRACGFDVGTMNSALIRINSKLDLDDYLVAKRQALSQGSIDRLRKIFKKKKDNEFLKMNFAASTRKDAKDIKNEEKISSKEGSKKASNKLKDYIRWVEKIKELEQLEAYWNIYLTGHGGPVEEKVGTKEIELMKKTLKTLMEKQSTGDKEGLKRYMQINLNEWLGTLSEQEINQLADAASSSESELQALTQKIVDAKKITADVGLEAVISSLYRQYHKNLARKINEAKTDLTQATKNRYQASSAVVAGVPFKEFVEILELPIHIAFLYFNTCFSGGYNQAFVNEVLKQLKVDFLVGTEGVSELYTYGYDLRSVHPIYENERIRFSTKFNLANDFFAPLHDYFRTTEAKAEKPKAVAPTLGTIVKSVLQSDIITYNSQPFIRIPHVGIFGALDVDQRVLTLTQVKAKARELEGQSIDATKYQTILAYPPLIRVPIEIGPNTEIVSMPGPKGITKELEIPDQYGATQMFSQIIVSSGLPLYNLLKKNASFYKTILVKDIFDKGINGIAMRNMILHIAGRQINVMYDYAGIVINISWTEDSLESLGAITLEKVSQKIATALQQQFDLKSENTKQLNEVEALAAKVLDPDDFDTLYKKEVKDAKDKKDKKGAKAEVTLKVLFDFLQTKLEKELGEKIEHKVGVLASIFYEKLYSAYLNTLQDARVISIDELSKNFTSNEQKIIVEKRNVAAAKRGLLREQVLESIKKAKTVFDTSLKIEQGKDAKEQNQSKVQRISKQIELSA